MVRLSGRASRAVTSPESRSTRYAWPPPATTSGGCRGLPALSATFSGRSVSVGSRHTSPVSVLTTHTESGPTCTTCSRSSPVASRRAVSASSVPLAALRWTTL
ncbi:MAG: hypothetical protein ACRDT6_12815 [Micromonosporaceae bacterium]